MLYADQNQHHYTLGVMFAQQKGLVDKTALRKCRILSAALTLDPHNELTVNAGAEQFIECRLPSVGKKHVPMFAQ